MLDRIKTQPAEEPVSLAEIRLQLGINGSTDTERDSVISGRIVSARRWAEQYTRRPFVTQTFTQYTDNFQDYFDLKPELQSVTTVKYLDTNGTLQTLASNQYIVDLISHRIWPAYNISWPDTRIQANAVQIEYISGYGSATSVPEDIKDAIKFIVGHWENYQGGIEGLRISTIPYAVTQLLAPYIDQRSAF